MNMNYERQRSPLVTILLGLLCASLILLIRSETRRTPAPPNISGVPAAESIAQATNTSNTGEFFVPTAEERATMAIFSRVSPSVVAVANKALILRGGWFGGFKVYEEPQGAGSGFVWDKKGHIISNYHVVHEADSLSVTFPDGVTVDAKLVGIAPDQDIAVLKVDVAPERLQPVQMAASRTLQVGQTVLAIGNPFGLDTTLTVGIISALGRTITAMTGRRIVDVIQTDAAINPGNSGGPLLNSAGDLVGITTAILSPSGAYAGIGFAVPSDTVARIVPQLIAYGRITRAGLGVQFLPDHVARRSGVVGAAVFAVMPHSPAANAGITGVAQTLRGVLLGDIITAVDEQPVHNIEDYNTILDGCKPGQEIDLTLVRGGQTRHVTLALIALE